MLAAIIILALMQPVTMWLTAHLIHRARANQSPALRFPHKVEVGDNAPEAYEHSFNATKGRNIL